MANQQNQPQAGTKMDQQNKAGASKSDQSNPNAPQKTFAESDAKSGSKDGSKTDSKSGQTSQDKTKRSA